jgi:hypothetical protein
MKKLEWFQRQFVTGSPLGMFPFYLDRLEGTIARLKSKIAQADENLLSYQLDGKWSIKENIGHLGDVEGIGLKRISEIRQGITPLSSAVIPAQRDFNNLSTAEVLDYFIGNRLACLNAFTSLTNDELQLTGQHPRLKIIMSPVDLALFHAEHDDHHLTRISEIIRSK